MPNNATPTILDNIKTLYKQVKGKTTFIKMVAEDLDKKPSTLRQHWFQMFWAIPEEHQARVVELLQNQIREQNSKVEHEQA